MQTAIVTVVVTGATQGIGKAIALALLEGGHRVIGVGRSAEKLKALRADAGAMADRLRCEALDIADSAEVTRRVADWTAGGQRIDSLVNAAGVLEPGSLLQATAADLRRVIDTNLVAVLDFTLAVARQMARARQGSIVTIGSNSGTTARKGLGAYPASKAGIIHAMKCLGLELAEHGVRCNIVSPGSTDTEMQARFQSTTGSRVGVIRGNPEHFRLGIPLGRMASVADVSDLVLFLLSDRARHITMENIVIDGGATLGAR